ncbi:MAG: peptidase T [Bacteroidales bacterium]|nr:peptidase T [Bacteroidales bacterium]MDD3521532.1 peptidase T [Bacteroidales bacterium]MDD4030791.1 peptidase T [Bacteroidales bacterium]MDD4436042.1 peptidase T [Bacteroidales bacterium]MDD5733318.1 peptidase T [Bacteroidales bacterium]
MEKILDKFLRYISFDTASDPESQTQPSTTKQLVLLEVLLNELHQLGIADACMDEYGYVMASIPSNMDKDVPAIGFIAHVDTSPDASGRDIRPQIVGQYDGKPILLNKEKGLYLDPAEFPELLSYQGQTLITTDGTTLLGADDKAGVAAIMTAVQYLMAHPEIKHGPVKIAFTPDEEIGRGVVKFDVEKFGADYAYTIDGGQIGEMEYENFNAAMARIHIQGRNIHPGYARGKMVNALIIGTELNNMLPVEQRPEFTDHYEGFFHLTSFRGTVEEAEMIYIIRDHDLSKFEEKKQLMHQVALFLNQKYNHCVTLEIRDQYFNMRTQIEPHMHIVEKAARAMKAAGITPIIHPIRGGTDGAQLSYRGLPCPNIFAGGHNFHGKMEYLPLESMEKASEVILRIIAEYTLI